MLSWLKDILGEAYTEEIDKKVSEQIGKDFVSRSDFNTTNEAKKSLEGQLKDRDKQLEELRKSASDSETLQQQIEKLQDENKAAKKEHEAELHKLKVDSAVTAALMGANAKNITAVKALLNLTDAKLAEDGTVVGLKDQITKLSKAEDTKFLFETVTIKGTNPGEPGDSKPQGITKEQFNKMGYKERLNLYNTNKEAYDALASIDADE